MTLGEMQVEAKKHEWDKERLPDLAGPTYHEAHEEWVNRAIMERLIEIADFANHNNMSLDVIAGKLSKVMR